MKPVRVKFIRNHEGIGAGETRIFDANTAQELIAIGAVAEVREIKPTGPTEFKPIEPGEIKVEEFSGKKKAKTRRS